MRGAPTRSAPPLAAALLLLAALACASRPAAAGIMPGLDVMAGRTFAVSGTPDEGGFAFTLGALWPVGAGEPSAVRAGVAFFANDMGDQVEQLLDPNDGTPLGSSSTYHRQALGGAFRLDLAPRLKGRWQPYASGTWGYYRLSDDVRGDRTGSWGATGWSAGAGLRLVTGKDLQVGVAARYHRLFEDHVGRYMDAGLEIVWR